MSRRQPRRTTRSRSAEQSRDSITKYAQAILGWSLLAMVLATSYLLYGIFSGQLSPNAPPRIVANLQLVGQVLAVSAGLSTVCLVLITFAEIAWSVLAGIVGLGYLLGIPFLISSHTRSATSPAAQSLMTWGTLTGTIIVAVVGVRILYEVYHQVVRGGLRPRKATPQAEEEEEAKPGEAGKLKTIWPWTPCWQLPFCHQVIREMCPAFKSHKPCWRFGRGCNCDPGLVEQLIRTGGVGASTDSQQRRRQQEYIRSDLRADTPVQRERAISCAQCAIYLEHQRAKFRFVNPILAIATILAFFVFYQPILRLYELTITGMATVASQFTYGSQVDPKYWFEQLNTPTVQVFFLIILGLLVLSWVLRFTEWLILVKKL